MGGLLNDLKDCNLSELTILRHGTCEGNCRLVLRACANHEMTNYRYIRSLHENHQTCAQRVFSFRHQ